MVLFDLKYYLFHIYEMIIFLKRVFQYNITKKAYRFPTIFHIQTINTCNGLCIMCPNSYKNDKKTEVMSSELFEKIAKEIFKEKLCFVYIFLYLQNEPFMDKEIFKRLQIIKKYSHGIVKIGITTNGTLLTDEQIGELEKSNVDELFFSLDAFSKEKYNKIRKGLSFNKLLENIEKVNKSKFKGTVFVNFTKQKENISELKDFKKYWNKKRIRIRISDITNRCGDLDDFKSIQNHLLKTSFLERFSKKLFMNIIRCCPLVTTNFNILSNGDVILCCNDYNNKIILGNVKDSTIKKIWNSIEYRKIRETLVKGIFKNISLCKNCSFYL